MGVEKEAKQDFQETVLMRWESSSSSSSTFSSSSSSLEISDDEETSSSSNSNDDHAGPLYQLSDLMTQLPIKRGLSKFYDGKSQTFTSLESVMSVEDLSKSQQTFNIQTRRRRRNGNRKMIKSCKSYAGGILELDSSSSSSSSHKSSLAYSPKAIISKKSSNSTSRPLFASFTKRSAHSSSMNVLLENI